MSKTLAKRLPNAVLDMDSAPKSIFSLVDLSTGAGAICGWPKGPEMTTETAKTGGPDAATERPTKRAELLAFLTLAVLIWPILAVGIVGGYGFLVWMTQIVFGPPGPPN